MFAEAATVAVHLLEGRLSAAVLVEAHGTGRTALRARAGRVLDGSGAPTAVWETPEGGFRIRLARGTWRLYPGSLRVTARGDTLHLENRVSLETYAAAVARSELGPGAPPEALAAQAVLARTLVRHGAAHPDGIPCDLAHCMVYAGAPEAGARRAVARSAGWVLGEAGYPPTPWCHASCGGHTATTGAGAGILAVSPGVPDPGCRSDTWERHLSRASLGRALGKPGMQNLSIRDRDPAGWVSSLEVDGTVMSVSRFMEAVGRTIGRGAWPSTRFELTASGTGWVIRGRGRGHGLGLCQTGAIRRARNGESWRAILEAYLPGTRLSREGLARHDRELVLEIARTAVERHLEGGAHWHPDPADLPAWLREPGGAFVTYTIAGKTRACWGRLQGEERSRADEIAETAIATLTRDRRHPPLRSGEWPAVRIQVTLPGAVGPMENPHAFAPSRTGLVRTTPGRTGLILPGEARTRHQAHRMVREKLGQSRARQAEFQAFPAWIAREE
ncbi:MAG: AMMECR1 domain-containing protein [bacterium]|nr:AMMECR1 domain-containing protein [bacterium]